MFMMAPKGRHPKRDLNPRFISPFPFNHLIFFLKKLFSETENFPIQSETIFNLVLSLYFELLTTQTQSRAMLFDPISDFKMIVRKVVNLVSKKRSKTNCDGFE